MIRQHACSLAVTLFIVLVLMGALALSAHTQVNHTIPVQHLLACGAGQLPPCA